MPALPSLSEARIAELLAPYVSGVTIPANLYTHLLSYLELLLRWNARTNLTAIRDPKQIVQRHFGESLFAGAQLATRLPPTATVLDFGSGAGFPGLPIQLLLPELRVTLAESQGKKASFLREVVRSLGLHTEIWAERVEAMPPERRFDAVVLRAVDRMWEATETARTRVAASGWLATISTDGDGDREQIALPQPGSGWVRLERQP